MREKHVIVHRRVIEEWLDRDEPPLDRAIIEAVLLRIAQVQNKFTDDIVEVEELPHTGFISLPDRVGKGNSVRLYGARAGVCLVIAQNVLEDAGIPVEFDQEGVLP